MAMTMYKRYEKIEKPLVELAKQIKKKKANDENIKKGIQLILGEEANAVASYLEDVLGFDSEYALPAMRADTSLSSEFHEPNMQEVENKISDMDECTDLINMITSLLPPGALMATSQAEHYSIMGEILEAYRAKNFMAVKELICANWQPADKVKEYHDAVKRRDDALDNFWKEACNETKEYDISDFTDETREKDIEKFIKLSSKYGRTIIEDKWCYTAALVITGILKPDMTMKQIEEVKSNKHIALESVKAYIGCMDMVEFNQVTLELTFDRDLKRVESIAEEKQKQMTLDVLKSFWNEGKKSGGNFDYNKMINYTFDHVLGIEKAYSIDEANEKFDDIVNMALSIFKQENIDISKQKIEDALLARVCQNEENGE